MELSQSNAALQNRVAFLINNISPKNVDTKVNEMRELITQELWPWFANYMVVKRAAQVRLRQVWTLLMPLLYITLPRYVDPLLRLWTGGELSAAGSCQVMSSRQLLLHGCITSWMLFCFVKHQVGLIRLLNGLAQGLNSLYFTNQVARPVFTQLHWSQHSL